MTVRKITQTANSDSVHRKNRPNIKFGPSTQSLQSVSTDQYFIDQSIIFCFSSRHEIVSFGIPGNLFDGFAGIAGQNAV